MLLGKKLQELREELKIPQRLVAEELSIDVPMYCRMERGTRPIKKEQIKILARMFKTDETELLTLWLADQVNDVLKDDGKLVKKVMNLVQTPETEQAINEFHLFAGIGGGIYGGEILGHRCCAGVEIDTYCKNVLEQRQKDGWMNEFPIYSDIKALNGKDFKGQFDVLCGGFPCQAFSYAAHGNNIEEKNLWPDMFRFVKESDAPIVFGENVTIEAIETAKKDLESVGYKVERCRVACMDLGADHKRPRFWLLAVKDKSVFKKVSEHVASLPKFRPGFWEANPHSLEYPVPVPVLAPQKRGVGNAQAPIAAATAFRVLVNRHLNHKHSDVNVAEDELKPIYEPVTTWVKTQYPDDPIYIHTPTTMGNYHYKSMMKHPSCAKYVRVFGKPTALHAEYLMGFPIGASSPFSVDKKQIEIWKSQVYKKL